MPRKLALLALLLVTSIASARVRSVAHPGGRLDAATVNGIITAVHGDIVSIADGLVTIDTSEARVVGELETGMLLFATVRPASDTNAPLQATMVATTRLSDASLTGPLDGVDTTARTLTLLGRTILVTDDTSFGNASGLNELLPNQLVFVQAEVIGGQLVATNVTVLARVTPTVRTLRGTVKSIGNNAWIISRDGEADVTVAIDTRTRIAGSPKVGDTVDVLYTVDNAHAFVAVAIVKFDRTTIPGIPQVTRVSGRVRTIGSSSWTIAREQGADVQVAVDSRTQIQPGITVNDRVEVLAREQNGTLTAFVILKRP
ncbi:MAG TPA: DUF5666 domain-containing protein [Thermoanaerobaculia bacterium]|nr:DUF5666 domain-containing protein [Thermoanaerobaculia bacterium]